MQRLFRLIQAAQACVLATAILAMAAITILNVVFRNLLGSNLAAGQELNGFLIVIVCFIGLPYAARAGRHIRMTALYDLWSAPVRRVLMILISASTALLLLALAWFAWRYARSVDRVSPVLGVPLGVVYLVAPLGLALAGVENLLTLWRNLTSTEVHVSFDRPDGYHEVDELTEI